MNVGSNDQEYGQIESIVEKMPIEEELEESRLPDTISLVQTKSVKRVK